MKWLPKRFNDTLALLMVVWIMAIFSYVIYAALDIERIGMILGALIGWGGVLMVFYFRKAGPVDPPAEPKP